MLKNKGCSYSGPGHLRGWLFRCHWLQDWKNSPLPRLSGQAMDAWCSIERAFFLLCRFREILEPSAPHSDGTADPLQVKVVFSDGDHAVGMVVDEILDIVEQSVEVRQRSARKGLLGSGVVGTRVHGLY